MDVYDTSDTSMMGKEVWVDWISHGYKRLLRSLESHIKSYLPDVLKKRCIEQVETVMKLGDGWMFALPFDYYSVGLFDYPQVIKHPMDLGNVIKKLEASLYLSLSAYVKDVHLVFQNAVEYNSGPSNVVHQCACILQNHFDGEYHLFLVYISFINDLNYF